MQHTPAPVATASFYLGLVLAVVAMHAAVLWLLLVATQPHGRETAPVKRMVMEVVQVEAPVKAVPPAPREAAPQPRLRPHARQPRACPELLAARRSPSPLRQRDSRRKPRQPPRR